MDINKLNVFLRAADSGSFIKTAQELDYTPSGITHMMNNLENELGFSLFIRTNRGVRLTDSARHIVPIIHQLTNANERLLQECALINQVSYGNVRVASFSSIAIQWIPAILENYKRDYPNVQVEILEESDSITMREWITEGYVDLCFFSLEDSYSFDMMELYRDPMVVILPKNHPLTALGEIPLERLRDECLLVASGTNGLDKDVMQILSSMPTRPKIDCTSNLDHAIISMVAHNLGISVMPALMIKGRLGEVAVRPLSPPVTRRLGIAAKSLQSLSPAAKQLIKYTKYTMKDLVEEVEKEDEA